MVVLEAVSYCQIAVQIACSFQIVAVFAERLLRRKLFSDFLFSNGSCEVETWIQHKSRTAAVQIQRLIRGFLGRKAADGLRHELAEKEFARKDAALQLQPVISGFLARNRQTSFTMGSYLWKNGYAAVRCLGQGGYGQVWLARGATGTVAIKRQSRAGAEHERDMLQRARGPGVVQLIEHFVSGCWGFLVLELGSMTLAHRLHLGNMCVQRGLVILGQLFSALSHIHALQSTGT